jgi:Derlin-2/3
MRYSRMLEESSFPNRKADYFWLLFLSGVLLLVSYSHYYIYPSNPNFPQLLSPLFNLPFLSSPLAFVPIYFWSRRHPSTHISLFGLVTITAPYLPVALIAFRYMCILSHSHPIFVDRAWLHSWIINGTWRAAAGDLIGCAVGHLGWFIRDVWIREVPGGSLSWGSHAPELV